HPGRVEPRFKRGFEHVARNARVLADEDHGISGGLGFPLLEHAAHGMGEPQHEVRRDGRLADGAAYAIGAKIFSAHLFSCFFMAASTFIACTVSRTSCTRTIIAPP